MFNFNLKKPNVSYAALLDIGSGSIGSAIVRVDRWAGSCELIYARRDVRAGLMDVTAEMMPKGGQE